MTNDSAKPIKKADSDRPQPIDITTRLRQTRANMLGTDDEDHYFDCHEAAGEIERLRLWGRLTNEEREALEIAVEYVGSAFQVEHHAAVIRRLLERSAKRDAK